MARLPVYQERQTLDTGVRFLRPFAADAQVGRALQRAGQTIQSNALANFELETREQGAIQAKAERAERIGFEADLQGYRTGLDETYRQQTEEMQPDGANHFERFRSEANKRSNELLKKYKGNPNLEEYRLRLQKLNDRLLNRAAEDEMKVSESKAQAYQFMSEIRRNSETAWQSSKFSADLRKRAEEYRAYTETLGLSPPEAIARIEAARKPETIARRKELKEQSKGWVKSRTFAEIQSSMDESMWSRPETHDPKVQAGLMSMYRRAVQHHIEQGAPDEETAKTLALNDIKDTWGITTAFTSDGSVSEAQRIMLFPPEKVFKQPIEGSHTWVGENAKEIVDEHVRKGLTKSQAATFKGIEVGKVFLVPRAETAQDYRRNNAGQGDGTVRYGIAYRDENGVMQVVPGLHGFNRTTEIRERIESGDIESLEQHEAKFKAARNAEMSRLRNLEQPGFNTDTP